MSEPLLDGAHVLIVDGLSDVGLATAQAFSDAGARVAISVDAATGRGVPPVGAGTVTLSGGVRTADGADSLVQEATKRLGGLDICVRFPPPLTTAPVFDLPPSTWGADVTGVLQGAYHAATSAAHEMARRTGGSIVLVGTVDAHHAYPGRSSAATAMAGLVGLARALAVELAPSHVRVNVVLLGPLGATNTEASGPAPEGTVLERTLLRSPLHRLGTAREAAAAIRFVAGPQAGFMTGQALRVDGGWASLNQAPQGMRFP